MQRSYYYLLSAYFISSIGDWLYKLAIPLLLYHMTHSPLTMAIAFALTFLPFVMVSPFGGVVADRFNRRSILIWGDFFSFIIILILAITTQFLGNTLWLIYLLVFLAAVVSPLYHPAFHSIIPAIVKPEQLSKANSLLSSADNFIMLLAPLLGGGLIAILGITKAIYFNAASFLLSAVLIALIPKLNSVIKKQASTVASVLHDLKVGFQIAWSHPVLKYGSLLFIGSNFAINLFYANFMYY